MRYSDILLEYVSRPDSLVYHGSKARAITQFEKRKGVRAAFFDTKESHANGFFFALTPQDALTYGPNVSSYQIRANKPLVFGTDGVDPIRDPRRKADMRYVFAAMLHRQPDGDYKFEGMTNDVWVRAEHVEANDLEQDDDWIYQFLGSGGVDWEVLDNPHCVARMRERGYDSTVVYEPSVKSRLSWFVMDANQIKFVAEINAPDEGHDWDDD